MKTLPWIAMIVAGIMTMAAPAYAHNPDQTQQESYSDGVVNKFSRGFANTATGWLELPKYVVNTSKASNVAYGISIGLLQGVMHTVGRTLTGVVELGTFFVPNQPFIHPKYVWSPFDQETTYGGEH